ncbi:hypothetical protein [Colwellia sp. MB3u-55]|uniref:hypothetical protein n=1 Tax=Colwellia sp. MB3u-55 TaxID=2759810 RepID=UPI0015F4E2F5|nr:hypothetical protein [Colwellia sp. MB3u-55]MBA6251961.1 hypothetical protein [Colwellia sp. MB3u-55]
MLKPNKAIKQENLQLAVFTAFNILANYKFPLIEALVVHGELMRSAIKKALFNFGGYSFWILLVLWAAFSLILKGCESTCYHEVVKSVASPDGKQVAEISIGDCGGATTDFFGGVDIKSDNPKLSAENLFTFDGRPEETGLEVRWVSDTELIISISDLYKARYINPNGRKSADLKVKYEYRK